MKTFKFDYDSENDDLFAYLDGCKSEGAVELGNFILDFDKKGNLVAMEILNATDFLSKILSKIIEIAKIKELKIEILNFRNMDAIKFQIISEHGSEMANILMPHIKEKSPVLMN